MKNHQKMGYKIKEIIDQFAFNSKSKNCTSMKSTNLNPIFQLTEVITFMHYQKLLYFQKPD